MLISIKLMTVIDRAEMAPFRGKLILINADMPAA